MNVCKPPTAATTFTGPERQMIGIREQHSRSGRTKLIRRQSLDRGLGSDWHERRGLERDRFAVSDLDPTC